MSMVKHPPNIQTYDPTLGQDYVVDNHSTKTIFSSLENGFYVLEVVGEMDWSTHQDMLLECILNTSTKGFFTVVPWHPDAKRLRRALLQQFSDAVEIDNSVVGYFDTRRQIF